MISRRSFMRFCARLAPALAVLPFLLRSVKDAKGGGRFYGKGWPDIPNDDYWQNWHANMILRQQADKMAMELKRDMDEALIKLAEDRLT